jgi:type I restriction enzyme S subunit
MDASSLEGSIAVLSGFPFPSAQFTTAPGKPLIRIRDLLSPSTETNFVGEFDPTFLVQRDDILIGMDGDFSVVRWKGPEALLNQRVCKVSVTDNRIDGRFLYWWLQPHIAAIHRRTPQTTVRHLSVSDVYRIPRPPIACDQQAIAAAMLDTIDEAIAKTEAVIAKLKQVRAGLLHDLLTRGIDKNGQLRDPSAHPEQFQNSSLGRIPREWTVLTIEALLAHVPNALRSGPFGSALLKQELKESGIPLLGIDNVHIERFVSSYTRFVDDNKFVELRRYAVRAGDVMITIMGTVGRCCVVPDSIGVALSSKHVWTITLDRSRYLPHVACWQMNFAPWVLRQFKRDEQGGVMTAIRSETLRQLLLPVPPLPEMQAIETILLQFNKRIGEEEALLAKLAALKSGLMTDLLTGRVRVPEGIAVVS